MQTALDSEISIKKLAKYFSWFNDEFSHIIVKTCEEYWKLPLSVKLFSLEKNSKNFFIGNDYFVSQAEFNTVKYSIRTSDTACEMFLTSALGTNDEKYFAFSNITELEATIISKFNKNILTELKDYFIPKKEIRKLNDNEDGIDYFTDCLYLGFVIKDNEKKYEIGKMFLCIPERLIKTPELEEKEGVIDTTKFRKAKTPVDIYIGKTRLSLNDVNCMEKDDIVVLENSDIKKMAIVAPANFEFNVNPDPRLFIKEDNFDENNEMEDISVGAKDIWDNVQVDVCAKFPKVKMSLGELREMAEGVVMELDSVYGNEVVLEVENKNVAKGELVIVGYKYGVKITEIYAQGEDTADEQTNANSEETMNEDFDVNDFDIKE